MAYSVMAEASPLIKPEPAPLPVSLRPKFKISEIPLNKEQRTTIDSLLYRFKKKGGYDSLRRKVWADYNGSDAKSTLTKSIQEVAEIEIDKDPNLLSRERGKAATLIQGAVDRSGVYHDVEAEMDRLIAGHLDNVLGAVREIRRAEVGDEKAGEEAEKGKKTDEQYTAETEARGAERERNRARMEELTRQTLELKAKIKKEEDRKRRELEKKKAEEERKTKRKRERRRGKSEGRKNGRPKRRGSKNARSVIGEGRRRGENDIAIMIVTVTVTVIVSMIETTEVQLIAADTLTRGGTRTRIHQS
jgi:hypothetical protein